MNILFLRGFNNYFNRVIKKYSTLADYQSDSTAYVNFESINFNPNDGVATELVLGNESQKENNLPLDWENIGTPDYCVCYEMVSSNPVIRSRWFVLESERLRSGQYRLALKHDVVAEHFDQIKTAPCFIEKGMINDTSNPLLYNKESMTYNQIKTAEYPLKDSTGCGWIVGYIAKNVPSEATTVTTTIVREGDPIDYYDYSELPFNVNPSSAQTYRHLDSTLDIKTYIPVVVSDKDQVYSSRIYQRGQWHTTLSYRPGTSVNITQTPSSAQFYTYFNIPYKGSNYETTTDVTVETAISANNAQDGTNWFYTHGIGGVTNAYDSNFIVPVYLNSFLSDGFRSSSIAARIFSPNNLNNKNTYNFFLTLKNSIINYTDADLLSYNGKIVKYSNNKYYQMNITESSNLYIYRFGNSMFDYPSQPDASYISVNNNTFINNAFGSFVRSIGVVSSYALYDNANHHFESLVPVRQYTIVLTEMTTETLSITIPSKDNRAHTFDNSADLFAIPYGALDFMDPGIGDVTTNASRGLAMARAIAEKLGETGCYDLQLVPYCPSKIVREYVEQEDYLECSWLESNTYDYIKETAGNSVVGFVLWCTSSKDTFDIDLSLSPSVGTGTGISQSLVNKLTNETQLCRVASPNFNGQFEFNLAKNNGITKFNVDYTYKPYNPYIHINPDFKFIYGQDWDDARGLICGGDFSLAYITSYWQTYINNNKNYQQIFDRQIQNMDVNNAIALEKQEFQATVGTITSAIGGALGGGVAGATAGAAAGPWGALIGGVVGAVGGGVGSGMASAYGAEKDRDWLQRQQAEARSFAIDMYGYQLGNIQAIPYSIKGTDALTNNNKIWPIVEIYNATDSEVELLKAKIQYNGMTVMAVGKIEDYYSSGDFDKVFIKGQLIKLDGLNDDFHIADAIYQEINKGVYIPSGGL